MNEHSLYNTGSFTHRTVSRRIRVHNARRNMAGMRARMAQLRSATAVEHLTRAQHPRPDEATA